VIHDIVDQHNEVGLARGHLPHVPAMRHGAQGHVQLLLLELINHA